MEIDQRLLPENKAKRVRETRKMPAQRFCVHFGKSRTQSMFQCVCFFFVLLALAFGVTENKDYRQSVRFDYDNTFSMRLGNGESNNDYRQLCKVPRSSDWHAAKHISTLIFLSSSFFSSSSFFFFSGHFYVPVDIENLWVSRNYADAGVSEHTKNVIEFGVFMCSFFTSTLFWLPL